MKNKEKDKTPWEYLSNLILMIFLVFVILSWIAWLLCWWGILFDKIFN